MVAIFLLPQSTMLRLSREAGCSVTLAEALAAQL
jgi:hypothetical protein